MKKRLPIVLIVLIALLSHSSGALAVKNQSELINTNQWALSNGYSFPIYGSTAADLTPISDYLSFLSQNGVDIELPELVISHDHQDYEWIYSNIDVFFYLRYISYNDGSKYTLSLQVPISYRYSYEALTCLIASAIDVDLAEAEALFNQLQIYTTDDRSSIDGEGYALSYYTVPKIGGFIAVDATKILK